MGAAATPSGESAHSAGSESDASGTGAAGQQDTPEAGATDPAVPTLIPVAGSYKPQAIIAPTATAEAAPGAGSTAQHGTDPVAGKAATDAQVPTPAPVQTQTTSFPAATPGPVGPGGHQSTGSPGHGSPHAQPDAPGPVSAAGAEQPGSQGPGTVAPAAASPAASGSPAAAHQPKPDMPDGPVRTSVHLQEAADAVRATFTAANRAGISSARISLSPASLGGIKISLSQTPGGLVARVATDHPEAAQTLQQNAAELRRSLEAGGMSLLRLDIGSPGQQSLTGFAGSDQNGARTAGGWRGGQTEPADTDQPPTPTELTIELSSGSLVNVLA